MANHTLTLTSREVLETAQARLAEHVELEAEGYRCTSDDLYKILIGASVQQTTIESACAQWVDTPGGSTVRNYLNEQLKAEELPELEKHLNQALVADLPRRIWRKARVLAIDMHDRCYYGKQPQEEGLWVRGKPQRGTTRFYRIATAYVVVKGLRFTLGIHFVTPDDKPATVVQKLIAYVACLKVPCKYWLLDRGFAGVDVQNYLYDEEIPAIIACPIRGKTKGTRALCQGRKSYRTQYTFNKGKDNERTAELAVCRTYTTARRTKRLKRRARWQLFILIHLEMKPQRVVQVYRYRFGIETSYRCANQVRARTTSPNPALRFMLMAMGIYLLNVWVALRWQFTQIPRRGRRKLNTKAFQLARFACFITYALDTHYGIVTQITAVAAPLL
jgi:putative transposase